MRFIIALLLCMASLAQAAQAGTPKIHFDGFIPGGAKIYVAPMPNHFDIYVIAGLQKKHVPVVVVADRHDAEYELTGSAKSDSAGWVKMLIYHTDAKTESADIKVVNIQTGKLVYAYSVVKPNAARGMRSTGESIAKHIGQRVVHESKMRLAGDVSDLACNPTNCKVYIARMPFHLSRDIRSELVAEKLPVTLVNSRENADFELRGDAEVKEASTGQKVLLSDWRASESVNVQMYSVRTSEVIFAYAQEKKICGTDQNKVAKTVAQGLEKRLWNGL